MHKHMLQRAPSLCSLNSLTSTELNILPEITHRARRGKDVEGQEGQEEEDVSLETEYESRTSGDEGDEDEDEDETPPHEVTPAVTGTTRPEKGKEEMSPSPVGPLRPKVDTLGLALLPSFKAPRE